MLEIDGLTVRFGGLTALEEVSLRAAEGEVLGLVGPNGSGKTTLINALTGIYAASGRVRFRGADLLGLAPERIVRLGLIRTFQNLRLFRRMTVLENVLAAQNGMAAMRFRDLVGGRRRDEARRAQARALVEQVGLGAAADRLAGELPLASQRRLELARALVCDPALLLLDEPAGGMTPAETREMTGLIASLACPGRTVIVVEHKMALITGLCTRLAVLNFGRLIAEGAPAEVLRRPAVFEAYLGAGAPADA